MEQITIFPDLSEELNAKVEQTIILDGQKVFFDKKVTLMPVIINNG